MDAFLNTASQWSLPIASAWLLVANLVTFAVALLVGTIAASLFSGRRVATEPDPLSRQEVVYAAAGIAANWLITVLAWWLWRRGVIVIRRDTGLRAWLDVPILVLVMDFAMYVLHRAVHLPWFFPIHRLHHEYDRPRPLSLFVLNPLETLGFGLLWVIVIILYQSSWLGLSIYLAINLGSGMLGHLGVEPFPSRWLRVPLLREVGTSTFHARHHQDIHHNFGFYTLFWDRLFGTLVPGYDDRFGQVPSASAGSEGFPIGTGNRNGPS